MSFLGGPRGCIGYRFSLAEYVSAQSNRFEIHSDMCLRTKALVFTLLRSFEFELGVPHSNIGKKNSLVVRPYLISNPAGGNQLPIRIKPVVA